MEEGTVHYDSIGVIQGMRHLPAMFTPGRKSGPGVDETVERLQRICDEQGLARPITELKDVRENPSLSRVMVDYAEDMRSASMANDKPDRGSHRGEPRRRSRDRARPGQSSGGGVRDRAEAQTGGASSLPGTIEETADRVTAAGGKGIAVRVDHGDDEQVKDFSTAVAREQEADILVNNAAIIRDEMMGRTKFWEEPLNVMDTLNVGVRSRYVATVYAAPLMLPQRKGLVVFTSASSSTHYAFGPAYGVPKAAIDKMAADMAFDFKEHGIASISIWMGSLLTQRVRDIIAGNPDKLGHILDSAETPSSPATSSGRSTLTRICWSTAVKPSSAPN